MNFYNKVKKNYLLVFIIIVVPFLWVCIFNIVFKNTLAWINGNTAVLDYPYKVYYSTNFPAAVSELDMVVGYGSFRSHTVLGIDIFTVPSGYEFVGWNKSISGDSTEFHKGDTMSVREDITLYAQWKLIDDNIIDDSDNNSDSSENDDVNNDDNSGDSSDENAEDNPNDKDENLEQDDNNSEENSSGTTGSGTGLGNGNSGSGSSSDNGSSGSGGGTGGGSSGNANGDNNISSGSSSNSNKPSNNNSSNNNPDTNDNDILEDEELFYTFKFISNGVEFASYKCSVLEDGTCNLVFPDPSPVKTGYTFKGWSLSTLCSKESILNGNILENGDNTYYACFELNPLVKKSDKTWIYLVISVWIVAFIAIYFIIKRFKNNHNEEVID